MNRGKPGLGGRRCQHCGAKVEGAQSKLLRDCPSCGAPLDGRPFTPQPKASGSFIPWIVVALLCVVVGIGIAVLVQVRALQQPTLATAAIDAGAEAATAPRIVGGTKPFERGSATQQLTDAAETVDDCHEQGGAGGTMLTTVLIQPNGKVSEVSFARSGFSETSQGKCIAERFSKIRVPPFAGPPEKLSKTVTLP